MLTRRQALTSLLGTLAAASAVKAAEAPSPETFKRGGREVRIIKVVDGGTGRYETVDGGSALDQRLNSSTAVRSKSGETVEEFLDRVQASLA